MCQVVKVFKHCPQHFSIWKFLLRIWELSKQALHFLHLLLFVPRNESWLEWCVEKSYDFTSRSGTIYAAGFHDWICSVLVAWVRLGHRVENMLFKIIIILQLIIHVPICIQNQDVFIDLIPIYIVIVHVSFLLSEYYCRKI